MTDVNAGMTHVTSAGVSAVAASARPATGKGVVPCVLRSLVTDEPAYGHDSTQYAVTQAFFGSAQ